MNRIARIGATGAVLTLVSLPLLPAAAMAKGGPSLAQNEQTAASHPTKAQVEYQERVTAPFRVHYGTVPESHLTKAQIEFNERSAGSPTSGQVSQPQTQLRINDDAAVWQLAVSAAAGALITGGVVLTSRGMGRRRQAMAG